MQAADILNPVVFSIEEAAFLVKYAGEAPEVVEIDLAESTPAGVNPSAVLPMIERLHRLSQQAEKRGLEWAGVPAVKACLTTYVTKMRAWEHDRRHGGPKHPSLYVWDERGKGHKGAVGSDSINVTTYFDEQGERHQFAMELVPSGMETYKPSWISGKKAPMAPKLIEDSEKGTIQCPVCYFTQNYDPATRSTYNLARGRMAKHLTASTKEPDRHREVHTQEFASANADVR